MVATDDMLAAARVNKVGSAEWLLNSLDKNRAGDTFLETTAKVMLLNAGEKATADNLRAALGYINEFEEPPPESKVSERNRYIKHFKKHLRAQRIKLRRTDRARFNAEFIDEPHTCDQKANFSEALEPIKPILASEVASDEHYQADVNEIANRFGAGFKFEKPQGTSLHHMMDYVVNSSSSIFSFLQQQFQSFVIEHNWAEAFKNVKDFDGGEVRLPFKYTAFEFRVSGVRILICLGETNDGIQGIMVTGINKRWYVNGHRLKFENGIIDYIGNPNDPDLLVLDGVLHSLTAQIRAVCIMLDAGVAFGERRAHDPAVNKRRAKQGKRLFRDYHVVTLSKRLRGNADRDGEATGIKKRLHWRRGHWAHWKTPGGQVKYINEDGITVSKTWRNWQLVGDESLGFVDKHYRL